MFADAIEKISSFTRPIKFISRNYKGSTVIPGLSTLFFINEDGWAITCRHVADQIIDAEMFSRMYDYFKVELIDIPIDKKRPLAIRNLENKYHLNSSKVVQAKVQFPGCVDPVMEIDFLAHPIHDIALLHFKGYKDVCYKDHAVFAKDGKAVRPGDMLCRLGFPFPEFTDFYYDAASDSIEWSENGVSNVPWFPMDGMFTRHVGDENGNVIGIELSTPGLRGQSGGPLFSSNGIIYGMQSITTHLHLGFDMVKEKMIIDGKQEIINNQPFLHVGRCVHVNLIKEFLDANNIKYYIGNSPDDVEVVNG